MKKMKSIFWVSVISGIIAIVLITIIKYLFFSITLDKAYIVQQIITLVVVFIVLYFTLRKNNHE